MSRLPHDDITPFNQSEKSKKEQVAEMFDHIAGRYDFMNRFLSARTDVTWRIKAINTLKKYNPQQILDIATGTGDMAIRAYKILHPQKISGIDISANMLEIGRQKIAREGLDKNIELLKGDSENMQFDDNSFDAAMAAFGVRNFENLEKGLIEINRILRPGGRLLILEFSRPKPGIFKGLYKLYMDVLAPRIAGIFSKDKKAYQYLNESASAFPEREDFLAILNKAGFKNTDYKTLTFGICSIYTGEK